MIRTSHQTILLRRKIPEDKESVPIDFTVHYRYRKSNHLNNTDDRCHMGKTHSAGDLNFSVLNILTLRVLKGHSVIFTIMYSVRTKLEN